MIARRLTRPIFGKRPAPANSRDDRSAVELGEVTKTYQAGRRSIAALKDVSLVIEPGEYVSIVGASGSGKSTLLNVISGIDTADSGRITILGRVLKGMNQDQLAQWRGRNVGIVFQFFQLMPTLTVRENVVLPMDLAGRSAGRWERADELIDMVGLSSLLDNLPSELSGGEQQRAAIARALANAPGLLLADEPTGNLDSENGRNVIEILEQFWKRGTTVIMVTHDADIARRASRLITMRDGRIISDSDTVGAPLIPHSERVHADAD